MQSLRDIEADPERPGSQERRELFAEGVRVYHLRFSRDRAGITRGIVQNPRHFLVYRRRDQKVMTSSGFSTMAATFSDIFPKSTGARTLTLTREQKEAIKEKIVRRVGHLKTLLTHPKALERLAQTLVADLLDVVRTLGVPAAKDTSKGRATTLTRREREVLALVVAGYANKEIARKFDVSEETIKHHLTRMFDKVGATNRLELAMLANERGLLDAS